MSVAAAQNPTPETAKNRAILLMAAGLYLIWSVGGFLAMRRWREPVRALFLRTPGSPWLKFFLFCLVLVCLEEAVTVGMTNLAPVFGSKIGESYITGSSNYVETVLWHSVVALFPAYAAWALVLRKAAIHPNVAYLFYGLQGVLAEASYGGPSAFEAFAFWISVYGPIVYLPAYCVYGLGEARRPGLRHFGALVVLSWLFTVPSVLFVQAFRPADAGFPEVTQKLSQNKAGSP